MNAFERFFYSPFGAARAYLFAKLFLVMLALDTWMLMIGHAGRYGVAGFNVAHFGWLDAIAPLPSAGFYVAVLLLTGLTALVIAFTGLRRRAVLALFALYTYSWSMSMLDSYQHHYFLSLVLLCMAFFPETRATDVHPLPAATDPEPRTHREREARAKLQQSERNGWLYAGAVLALFAAYFFVDARGHGFIAFFLFAGALVLATWFYSPTEHQPRMTRGWGFPLLGATAAIVYTYTAIAKMDPNWIAGHTIRQISSGERVFAALVEHAEHFGIGRERFWSWLASAVIPQELSLAGCYLLAVHQDRAPKRWLRALCSIGFLLACTLHLGAEAMGLQIGWFSYYMLALAVCFLLPLPIVDRLATVFTWPARVVERELESARKARASAIANLGFAMLAFGLLAFVGDRLDLPGALSACVLAGLGLVAYSVAWTWRKRAGDPRALDLAVTSAAFAMWLAIALSPVRWDFYRFLGGDLSRRHESQAALDAYLKGERYAPPGESRARQIRELKTKLGR